MIDIWPTWQHLVKTGPAKPGYYPNHWDWIQIREVGAMAIARDPMIIATRKC